MTTLFSRTAASQLLRPEPVQVEMIRRSDAATAITDIITTALNAWFAMLILGALHSRYPVLPAVSYVDAMLGLLLLSILSATVRPTYRYWRKK